VSDPFADDVATQRRDARERAVSLLYEAEMKSAPIGEVIDDLPLVPDGLVGLLAMGVGDNLAELDEAISGALDPSWSIERLSVLDRLVLRLGVFELTQRPDVPVGAAINEAVELAKHFSGPEASKFVNGVLSTIAKRVRS
jgi:N utilization substance protein B